MRVVVSSGRVAVSMAVLSGAGVSWEGAVWARERPSALLWILPALCLME